MKKNTLIKIGLIIFCLVWIISYYFKHIFIDVVNIELQQTIIDYFITIGYCAGTAIISFHFYMKEKAKGEARDYLLYFTVMALSLLIIGTYIIDLLFDSFFGTTKVFWSIIITATFSLCTYFLKRKC